MLFPSILRNATAMLLASPVSDVLVMVTIGISSFGPHLPMLFLPALSYPVCSISPVFGFKAMRLYDSLSSVFKWEAIT